MHSDLTRKLTRMLQSSPVIPVITLERLADAVPLAEALVAGGLTTLEITLRSKVGLEAIRRVAAEVPKASVGAGTVLCMRQFEQAENAGARFIVSPGTTLELLEAARHSPVPFLPGAATASEFMSLFEAGYSLMKFFPAEPAGGKRYLAALAAPLPELHFCPTGGISAENARSYLELPNVVSVGGSWICPAELVREGEWKRITELARQAAALGRNQETRSPVS